MREHEREHELERIIGYKFHNIDLLTIALTHTSYANAGGQLTQLVPAFYRDRVPQVTALQQGQLFFQLVDVPGLAADGQQKQH